MSTLVLHTTRLQLVLDSTAAVLARIDAMSPGDRAEVSPDWLARVRAAVEPSPWTHGFAFVERTTGTAVGSGGYKGPPEPDGTVEIAYGVEAEHRGRGYAKEAVVALVEYAFHTGHARVVRAHTRPENSASARVIAACGFERLGEVLDPEDGLVWRWELTAADQRSL